MDGFCPSTSCHKVFTEFDDSELTSASLPSGPCPDPTDDFTVKKLAFKSHPIAGKSLLL